VKVLLFNFSDVDFESEPFRCSRQDAEPIDADYHDFHCVVNEGDRIAQLVLERVRRSFLCAPRVSTGRSANLLSQIYTPEVVVVEQLEASVRGAGGFGSTG
jgi:hypothetical protein